MIRQEIETKSRMILENEHFIALAPYAPRFPFETWILPRQHSRPLKICRRRITRASREFSGIFSGASIRAGRSLL